jgi:hypothetical protein
VHELSAADALRPSPVCILDLPLAEYSIGHELLLFRRRNALAILSPEEFSKLDFSAQIYAIREAIWICSDSFSARDRFERPARIMWGFRWNEWKRKRWAKRLKHLLPDDYALAAAEVRNYLAASQSFPPMPTPHSVSVLYPNDGEETGRGFGQPLFLTLYHFVSALPKAVRRDNGHTGFSVGFSVCAGGMALHDEMRDGRRVSHRKRQRTTGASRIRPVYAGNCGRKSRGTEGNEEARSRH